MVYNNINTPPHNKNILLCGGVGGHIKHPHEITSTGENLINLFKQVGNKLQNSNIATVKFDGVNYGVKFNGSEFVLDRGTANIIDIVGINKKNITQRFDVNHPLINKGNIILNILNGALYNSYSKIYSLLHELNLTNKNIILNIEYIDENDNININNNKPKYIVIHGLKKSIHTKTNKQNKYKRILKNINQHNNNITEKLINQLNIYAKKHNVQILGNINVKYKTNINVYNNQLNNVLNNIKITLYLNGNKKTQTLQKWLNSITNIPNPFCTTNILTTILNSNSINFNKDFPNIFRTNNDIINISSCIICLIATALMGNVLLRNLTSPVGNLNNHEGIVVNTPSLYHDQFKITGKYIFKHFGIKPNKLYLHI